MTRRALIVAGLDPSAGAGLLLDAFVLAGRGYTPCAAVTLVTAQNSVQYLAGVPVGCDLVARQISAVLAEGPVACVKIGAVGSGENARVLAEALAEVGSPIVLDPVLRSTSGGDLFDAADIVSLDALARTATVITPNGAEAAALAGLGGSESVESARAAGRVLSARWGRAVVVTGVAAQPTGDGHARAVDIVCTRSEVDLLEHPLVEGVGDVRGTGCIFASSMAASLGAGLPVREAVRRAQHDVAQLLMAARAIGKGRFQVDLSAMARCIE